MADIRINALATTAASTASDDFVAVDGSANGTRKLNAFSPTFGGNVVATGTLTVNSTTDSSSKDTGAIITEGGLGVEKSATIGGNLTVSGTTTIASNTWLNSSDGKNRIYPGTNSTLFYQGHGSGVNHEFRNSGNTAILQLSNDLSATLAGNLTVSGTGTSSVAGVFQVGPLTPLNQLDVSKSGTNNRVSVQVGTGDNGIHFIDNGGTRYTIGSSIGLYVPGDYFAFNRYSGSSWSEMARFAPSGNFLIGATIDGGQKLQVSGTGYFSAGITIGGTSDVGTGGVLWQDAGSPYSTHLSGANLKFETGSNFARTTALTLDSSQNATFAGTVTSTGTLKAVTNLALTTVSGYNFIGFNNANNLTTATGIYSATGDTTLYLNVPTGSTVRARINGVDKLTVSETTATFANSIAIGNTVNTVSPTSPNRTITMVIGGTTYYIHAKTTND